MAAMTTVLTEFSNKENSRTSTRAGHTVMAPKLVIEKRRVPDGNQTVGEYSFKVLESTEDAEGLTLSQKVTMESIVRYPVAGQAADIAAVLAVFRDIVAGDEFANSVSTQEWL